MKTLRTSAMIKMQMAKKDRKGNEIKKKLPSDDLLRMVDESHGVNVPILLRFNKIEKALLDGVAELEDCSKNEIIRRSLWMYFHKKYPGLFDAYHVVAESWIYSSAMDSKPHFDRLEDRDPNRAAELRELYKKLMDLDFLLAHRSGSKS